jgi:regulator of sigma E protease
MLLTILIFIIILGLLVFVHELGHFVMAKRAGMAVEEFGFGFPPRLFGIKRGETTYSINWIPLGGFVKIVGEDGENPNNPRSFGSKNFFARFSTLAAGVTMNMIFAWILLSIALGMGLPNGSVEVSSVHENSPAINAELMVGDQLVKVNGTEIFSPDQLQTLTKENAGKDTTYTIKRGEETFDKQMVPRENPPEGQGALGVTLRPGTSSYPWYEAPLKGLEVTWRYFWATIMAFGTIIGNLVVGEPAGVEVTGPVGIAKLTGDVAALGFVYLLQFTAILSINLAIINAVPFPALDGGRLLFLVIEKIRGRKMNPLVEQWTNTIGFALLLLLMLIVTIKDVSSFNLFGRIKDIF